MRRPIAAPPASSLHVLRFRCHGYAAPWPGQAAGRCPHHGGGLSFRHWLLLAFALITAPLAGAALQALLTLEDVARQSRLAADSAVGLTANLQRLAERTVAMERSARQFLVLDDAGFRERYGAARQDARGALQLLKPAMPGGAQHDLAEWEQRAAEAEAVLYSTDRRQRQAALQALTPLFARLHGLNAQLAQHGRRALDRRGDAILDTLERQRQVISALVLGAIALAVLLAFGLGHWLSRPMARIEAAIMRLGDNRFDLPVSVRGPADLRRLGQQLDWLRHRLAVLESDKNRFVRHISHELKTPLASIREAVALLGDGVAGSLNADQREVVRILGDNAAALQGQIEDLLRYQALASQALQVRRRRTDLAALLQQVVQAQRLHWQAKSLTLVLEPAPGSAAQASLAHVEVDGEMLTMAVANLLSNAVRFSPPGAQIRLAAQRGEGGCTLIDCIDQGPGVAADEAERIFEPFYQGRRQPAGARQGSGIGLSIVREVVQAHAGRLRLLPSPAGAHFRIELPDEI